MFNFTTISNISLRNIKILQVCFMQMSDVLFRGFEVSLKKGFVFELRPSAVSLTRKR